MKSLNKIAGKIVLGTIIAVFLAPVALGAQESETTGYRLLAPLPIQGLESAGTPGETARIYIEGFFRLIIAVAGGLAVVMIVVGGIKYMSTDSFGDKNEGKNTVQNALWGFILAISAWLILNTISGGLTQFNLNIEGVEQPPPISSGGGPSNVPLSCNNCVSAIGVPLAPGNVCRPQTPGGSCMINAALNDKLVHLNSLYAGDFEVTEAWPPTVTHRNSCHRLGTCVDVGLGLGRNRTPQNDSQNIINFINSARAAGLVAIFEVPNPQLKTQLVQQGVPEASVQTVPGVSPHFSVYN